MQWSANLSKFFSGNRGAALQLLSGAGGLIGIAYGVHVLMVERSQIPICSVELLESVNQQSFLKDQQLTVEVAGAVVRPGVWQLPLGSRIAEAIERAGGFSQRADRTYAAKGLNLADSIKDGQKIYVPFVDEEISKTDSQATADQSASSTGKISINSATNKELEALPGIGESRAAEIVENRPYTSIDELVSREILTASVFDGLKELVSL